MTLDFQIWRSRKAARYVEQHNVQPAVCERCEAWMQPMERVARLTVRQGGKQLRPIGLSGLCPKCRACTSGYRRTRSRNWGETDYTALAEQQLYPGVRYHALTPEQRRHAYFLARLAWFYDGNLRFLMGFDADPDAFVAAERERLRAMRLSLGRMGFHTTFSPLTDWMDYGNDHADVGRRAPGTLAFGRTADPHGDAARAETEVLASA